MDTAYSQETRWSGLREVMGMSGPIILGTLSYTVMQFVDQIMVAWLGTDALAAIGSAGIWSYVMGCFVYGLVGVVGTFVAQSYGQGDHAECGRYTWQGIYLSLLAGALALILWPTSDILFHSMRHSPDVTRMELSYFQLRLIGYFPMACVMAQSAFFQAIGRPGIPTFVAIGANILNVVLDYLLIFGVWGFPRMEIGGAALATSISLIVQAVVMQAIFMGPRFSKAYHTREGFAFSWRRIYDMFRIGTFAGLSIFMDVANWAIFTSYIVGYFGDVSLAAHTAALALMHLSFMPALGLNHGIAAIVGQHIGRKRQDIATARTYTAIKCAMAYMVFMGLMFALFGRQLMALFGKGNPAVIHLGYMLLLLAAVFQAFDAINIVVLGALRGAGDTRWVAVVTFLLAYFFFLPVAMLLAFTLKMGAVGAWVGATIYIIGLSGILLWRFRGGRWQEIVIFSEA